MKNFVIALSFLVVGNWATAQKTAANDEAQFKKEKMEKKRAEHMTELQQELNLTPEQVNKIQALHSKRKECFKKNKETMDVEMKTILTPQQYEQWETKKKEKRAEKRAKMMATGKDRKWGQIK